MKRDFILAQRGEVAAAARDNRAAEEEQQKKKNNVHDIQAVAVTRTSVSVTDRRVTPSEARQASPGSLGKTRHNGFALCQWRLEGKEAVKNEESIFFSGLLVILVPSLH